MYTPPFSFSINAHTISEFTGDTVTPLIPQIPPGSPLFVDILVQVSPSSVLFHKAEPSPPLDKLYGVLLIFQVVAYKTLELFGSIIKSTTPASLFANNFLFHVFPPSTDL